MSTLKYQIGALAIVGLLGSGNLSSTLPAAQEKPAVEKPAVEEPAVEEPAVESVASPKPAGNVERAESVEKSDKKARVELSDDQRAAAMKFAEQNHPELARLLEQLQKSRPHESARAIKELTQQIQALEKLRERSPARYASQLEAWKHESQIRVLMARWARSNDAELETQVRELLKARRETRLAQLRADKERLLEQQQKIEQQLAALEQPVEELVDREWEQLSKKAAARKPTGKNPAKETTKPAREAKSAEPAVDETQ